MNPVSKRPPDCPRRSGDLSWLRTLCQVLQTAAILLRTWDRL